MTRAEFKALCARKMVVLDGATGTELVKQGMPPGVCPEAWILDHSEALTAVQGAYAAAGADIVYVPSFGGNAVKLGEFGLADKTFDINRRLAELSRRATGPETLIFGDLAPTGNFVVPIGEWPFEEAVRIYVEQVRALLAGGVDGFVIETMMDLQEARAALLAIRENGGSDLPVMVTMTFESGGRTLTGCLPEAALAALQALGADAFGCNCSTGPGDMAAVIARIKPYAKIPLIAKPNAGLPLLRDGKTVFTMDAAHFAAHAGALHAAGVNLLGGCCGTTPEHIRLAAEAVHPLPPPECRAAIAGVVASSRQIRVLAPETPFTVIGERINPTGKKALQAELRAGSTELALAYALEQTAAGAGMLDVNMGLSGIDESAMMRATLTALGPGVELPLCIDSTNPETVEAALRLYPGRALLNSISLERERIEKVLPVAAKYGAMLILLPLDDHGVPDDCAGRVAIVRQLAEIVRGYGYDRSEVAVDALVMAVSAAPEAADAALQFIRWCRYEFGVNTVCGLSNVSFGLPNRGLINRSFLAMAMAQGLNMAIANPMNEDLMQTIRAGEALTGCDARMTRYLAAESGSEAPGAAPGRPREAKTPEEEVFQAVCRGDADHVVAHCEAALAAGMEPKALLDDCLVKAIEVVGDKFERKEFFLPQLLSGADALRRAVTFLEPKLRAAGAAAAKREKIILATVKGDIHDIGKNIVAVMLANAGFDVIDLGKDVPGETILDRAAAEQCRLVGLSALMTTTMTEMPKVIEMARQRGMKLRFLVGGAVVDEEFARAIGAEYGRDALATVRLALEQK